MGAFIMMNKNNKKKEELLFFKKNLSFLYGAEEPSKMNDKKYKLFKKYGRDWKKYYKK